MLFSKNPDALGVYVHIPYCQKKCPYCDFNSYAAPLDEKRYLACLEEELRILPNAALWQSLELRSIFFGGGTPSLFSAGSISEICTLIRGFFPREDSLEISLEANPGTIQEELGSKLREFHQAGVNRLSLGVQSFNNKKLQTLGRIHSAEDSIRSIEAAREAGFANISIDLIFGTPEDSLESWGKELETSLSYSPEHISAYSLTIEPGTPFAAQKSKGLLLLPKEREVAKLFTNTQAILCAAGYHHYEISNYCRAGYESRHNSAYWSRQSYLGLGLGAHSFLTKDSNYGTRWINQTELASYFSSIENKTPTWQTREDLSQEQAELEMLLSFRRAEGIYLAEYQALFGVSFLERYDEKLKKLLGRGLVKIYPERVSLTEEGFLLLDSVIAEFL